MASDPGGGEPSWVFGSRFGILESFDPGGRDLKSQPGFGKGKKRAVQRNSKDERFYSKEARVDSNNGSRYLILSRAGSEETMEKVSPFFIKKAIDSITSQVTISRMKDGKLLLKTVDKFQADKLLKQKILGGSFNVSIEEHPTLNTTKGIVYCRDLNFLSDVEILAELKSEHVIGVRRIQKKNAKGDPEDTGAFVLTFNLGLLPISIDVGFHRCRVQLYVPSPLRCMNCLKFGHHKDRCRGNQMCAQCAGVFHDGSNCQNSITCINCRGPHSSLFKGCPVYEDEYEIQRIRVSEKLSLREAKTKRRLQAPNPIVQRLTESYSRVTKTGTLPHQPYTQQSTNSNQQRRKEHHLPSSVHQLPIALSSSSITPQSSEKLLQYSFSQESEILATPSTTIEIQPTKISSLSTESNNLTQSESTKLSTPTQLTLLENTQSNDLFRNNDDRSILTRAISASMFVKELN
ncbi:uncharacterized protein LOC129742678 [Uranotaenia lowii]|uniref:uncharacterized protein LOC129742678 n=1 Tax=Uranotaenia lowii TaxID=190385 RepID=UPI002479F2FD|nr:uncharacterized protein LOC129742678 [Uranotaenia lowii]